MTRTRNNFNAVPHLVSAEVKVVEKRLICVPEIKVVVSAGSSVEVKSQEVKKIVTSMTITQPQGSRGSDRVRTGFRNFA